MRRVEQRRGQRRTVKAVSWVVAAAAILVLAGEQEDRLDMATSDGV